MDSGWAIYEGNGASMTKPRPELRLNELVKYGEERGVDLSYGVVLPTLLLITWKRYAVIMHIWVLRDLK